MTDDKHIELAGIVKECIRGVVTVELASGQSIKAQLSGKMKMNKINVLPGDQVHVKVSPYDTTKGFIFKLVKKPRFNNNVNSSEHK